MIRLKAGEWRAELEPAFGGAIRGLTFQERPILRPTPNDAKDPLRAACFPLVPYANRIDHGRFRFRGQAYDVGAAPSFEPHALHGVGWQASWSIAHADARAAELTMTHVADRNWPWNFDAAQRITLSRQGFRAEVSLTNTDDVPAPAGVGLHPYLHRCAGARLTVSAPRVWRTDDSLIPCHLARAEALFDWSAGPRIADAPFVDNAYEGWTGEARLASSEGVVVLRAPGVSRVHVYAPQAADFVCVEPVSHRPDALNAPQGEASGLAILQPGESISLTLFLAVC